MQERYSLEDIVIDGEKIFKRIIKFRGWELDSGTKVRLSGTWY